MAFCKMELNATFAELLPIFNEVGKLFLGSPNVCVCVQIHCEGFLEVEAPLHKGTFIEVFGFVHFSFVCFC